MRKLSMHDSIVCEGIANGLVDAFFSDAIQERHDLRVVTEKIAEALATRMPGFRPEEFEAHVIREIGD